MNTKLSPRGEELVFIFHEQKLLILQALLQCEEDVCGCDLIEKMGITKDLLSYHIRTLREKGYIEEVKCGRSKKYTVSQAKLDLVKNILKLAELI